MKSIQVLLVVFSMAVLLVTACKEGVRKDAKPIDVEELTKNQPETHGTLINEGDIKLSTPLEPALVSAGKSTYELKCQSCHKGNEVTFHLIMFNRAVPNCRPN